MHYIEAKGHKLEMKSSRNYSTNDRKSKSHHGYLWLQTQTHTHPHEVISKILCLAGMRLVYQSLNIKYCLRHLG